jgi:hypothetical protein
MDKGSAMAMRTALDNTPPVQHSWRRRAAIGGLLVLVAAVWMAWAMEQPPAPLPASAPPQTFSTDRAWRHLERIAGEEPTPVGSAGSDEIRDYLVAQLRALDLDVDVQAGIGAHAFGQTVIVAGRAENVVATLPGHDPTGRLMLAAHYDSPATSPGASDDKASVAAILEIARALTGGERLRNDIVFLLSDGEEPGLIGGEAFARQHPMAADGGVMLNLEGPGNAGPAAMYNTSSGNAELIREFARSVPRPVGESAVSEFYRLGPFNSDFTVLRESGFIGLEFGPIDGRAYYHHPNDTVDNFDPASLQHQGANALALTRALGDRDLDELRSAGDASFFTAFGRVVHYPSALVWPLAVLALAAVIALGVLARARGLTSAPRLFAAVLLAAAPIVVAPLAAAGLWALLVEARPAYGDLMSFDPYRPVFYRWALTTATIAVVVAWYLALRRRIGPSALTIGALVWPALFGLAMAALVPGMSYYGALTAFAAALGGIAGVLTHRRWPVWHVVALTAGALPGAVLWSIGGRSLLSVLGIGLGSAGVFFFAMATLTALPLLAIALPAGHARRWPSVAVPAALVTLTLALTWTGMAVDRFDEDHPEPAYLMYVQDADTGTALWGSVDDSPHEWAARYVPDARTDNPVTAPLPSATTLARTGPAEATTLAGPEITVLDSRTKAGTTVLRLRATSHRDAYAIGVYVDRPVSAATLDVAGHPAVELPAPAPGSGDATAWPWELQFYDPPADGVELTLRIPGTRQPRIGITDWTNGLDGLPGYTERPPAVGMPPAGPPTDSVVVTRVYRP